MADDQAQPTDVPAEAPPPPETPQTPVSDGLASVASEPAPPAPSEPTPAVVVEPLAPAPTPEAAPSEPEAPEPEPAPRTQGAASAASSPSTVTGKTPEQDRELLKIARAKIQTKKKQALEKIMTLFEKQEKITNDDVEKLLHCSDATARRYLNELIKQGKLKRIGKTGKAVTYTKL